MESGRENFAGSGDLYLGAGLAAGATDGFHGSYDVHTFGDFAEHDVLAVEPGGDDGGDEELGAVGVWAGVRHRQEARFSVFELEVFIGELVAVNRLAAGAVVVGEIATLAHEIADDAVEAGAGVAETFRAGTQGQEVGSSLGNDVGEELENDASGGLATNGYVEVNGGVGHGGKRLTVSVVDAHL